VLGLGGSRLTIGGPGGGGGTTWLDLVALDCSGVSGSGYQVISRVLLAAV
jgi:hypothetical protein